MKFKLKSKIFAKDISKNITGDSNLCVQYVSSFLDSESDSLVFYNGDDFDEVEKSKAKIILVKDNLISKIESKKNQAIVGVTSPINLFIKIISESYNNENEAFNLSSEFNKNNHIFIGKNSIIFPNTTLYSKTYIGNNCRIQSSTVVGAIGLAYSENTEYPRIRFPHLGGVSIGDNVDIGSNTTIVKGILQDTVIGSGSKIGNNVNIGHNVIIGQNCFISSGVTLSGSVVVEDNCWISPSVTVVNKVNIRKDSFIGSGSLLHKDTEPGGFYVGNPARKVKQVS
jgi:UDP-3-O-[3-hydroxymyristoyl] glucosamine N-acyltransferase